VSNGWNLWFHPLLIDQLRKVVAAARAEEAAASRGLGARLGPNNKLLKRLWSLIRVEIPQDPASDRYRQGKTLGPGYAHWRRGKTGNGRYRLFFRYRSASKTIIYVWVNDSETLRARGARTDAYQVFGDKLDAAHPPDDWDALLAQCQTRDAANAAKGIFSDLSP
jgi:toxin YhaV